MKRCLLRLAIAASLAGGPVVSIAQDAATRAAAIADRDAVDERNKRLTSSIDDLWAAKAEQDRRLSALAEEIRSLRTEMGKLESTKYATRDELRTLAEKLQEIDNKRVSDRKLIEEKFADLKTDLKKVLNAPAPAAAKKPKSTPAADASTGEKSGGEKPAGKSPDTAAAAQEGVWYEIQSGNTLAAIVAAHNDEFKKQGKKTSIKLVQDANPGLKPTSMQIGQKIFVPLVSQ
jgi:DNA repair exonuclease SbcCD ATPase subunit